MFCASIVVSDAITLAPSGDYMARDAATSSWCGLDSTESGAVTMLPSNYNPDDGYGIRHDALVDGRITVQDNQHRLREIYVELDAIADRPEVWTKDELAELRGMQQTVSSLLEEQEKAYNHIQDELESLQDE